MSFKSVRYYDENFGVGILCIPDVLLLAILEFCSYETILSLSQVCHAIGRNIETLPQCTWIKSTAEVLLHLTARFQSMVDTVETINLKGVSVESETLNILCELGNKLASDMKPDSTSVLQKVEACMASELLFEPRYILSEKSDRKRAGNTLAYMNIMALVCEQNEKHTSAESAIEEELEEDTDPQHGRKMKRKQVPFRKILAKYEHDGIVPEGISSSQRGACELVEELRNFPKRMDPWLRLLGTGWNHEDAVLGPYDYYNWETHFNMIVDVN